MYSWLPCQLRSLRRTLCKSDRDSLTAARTSLNANTEDHVAPHLCKASRDSFGHSCLETNGYQSLLPCCFCWACRRARRLVFL